MSSLNAKVSNSNTFVIADLATNSGLVDQGVEFGKTFNTSFNTLEKKTGELAVIVKAMIQASASKPQDFAQIAKGFASKIDRKNWNSVATFVRTTAKKAGFKISMTSDKSKTNKKSNLLKASFIKIDIEGEAKALEAKKEKTAKQDAKNAKQHDADIIADHVASHGDMIELPTTQKAIVALFQQLLVTSSVTTKQSLLVMVGADLEALATNKEVAKLEALVASDEKQTA